MPVSSASQSARAAGAHERLVAAFRRPPDEYGPNPAWWWTGERLIEDRLEWQMRQFHAGGLRQVTVISIAPHGPRHGFPADDPAFYSQEWWACFRHVARVARELGMKLWYFDHIGVFPTRFPAELVARCPEFRARELTRYPVGETLPRGAEVLAEIGGYAYATAPLPIFDHYAAPTFYDLYNPAAGAALIDAIHGEMERQLGDLFCVIGGSFQDELRALPSWASGLPDAFRERTGRNLVDCLPALFDATIDDPGARSGYHQSLAGLAESGFFQPLNEWHTRRGLLVVCDQLFRTRMGDPLAGTLAYEDYARTHRWFNGIGNDHNAEAKVHSSIAHLYQRPRTFLEAFHSSGWGGTLEETFQWLLPWLQRGSTLYGPHAIYYTTKGSWLEWAPPSTGFRQPYWRHYPAFADTIARLCWLMSQGTHCCDVALFYPTSSVQGELTVSNSLYSTAHRKWRRAANDQNVPWLPEEQVARVFWEIAGSSSWRWQGADPRDDRREWEGVLDRLGLDFDVIDEDSVRRAAVGDGLLAVSGEAYRVLIFPQVSHLPCYVLNQANDLAQSGGLVAFIGQLPRSTCEVGPDDPVVGRVLGELLGPTASPGLQITEAIHREHPGRGAAAYLPDVDALAGWLGSRMAPEVRGDVRALHRRVGDLDAYLLVPRQLAPPPPDRGGTLVDLSAEDVESLIAEAAGRPPVPDRLTVSVRQPGPVEQWDPHTGQVAPARVLSEDGEWTTVDVDLTSAPVGLLVFGRATTPGPPCLRRDYAEVAFDDAWQSELIATVDNVYGDLAWPPAPGPVPVEIRTVRMVQTGANPAATEERDVVCGFAPSVEAAGPFKGRLGGSEELPTEPGQWRRQWYSPRLGIEKDPVHRQTLGPRAHVPPEFVDLGQPEHGAVTYVRTHAIVAEPTAALLRVISSGAILARVNGRIVGTGAGEMVAPVRLDSGANAVLIELAAPGRTAAGTQHRLRAGFHFLRAGAAPPYGHPLTGVPDWLNHEGPADALPGLVLDPHPEHAPRQASYSCRLPPGARRVWVATSLSMRASVDGYQVALTAGAEPELCGLIGDLPYPERLHRTLTLDCELPVGVGGGGAFDGPLRFECGPGMIAQGDWRDEGLPHHVGGVRYARSFELAEDPPSLTLDLGRVRGTVEVVLNGRPCGTRIWSPYRFDLTPAARRGQNRLAVSVFGTVGNHYLEGHPSPYGLRSQSVLGLLGPVRLLIG